MFSQFLVCEAVGLIDDLPSTRDVGFAHMLAVRKRIRVHVAYDMACGAQRKYVHAYSVCVCAIRGI